MDARRRPPRAFAVSLAATLLFTTGVHAQQAWQGFYLGGGGGYSTVSVEVGGYDDCDDDCCCYWWGDYPDYDEGDGDYGYSLHGGYRFNDFFAIEASYIDTGSIEWDKHDVYLPEFDSLFHNRVTFSAEMPELALVGILPFAQRWEVYLKAGAGFWDGQSSQRLQDEFTGQIITRDVSESGVGFLMGFGVGVSLAEAWHVRLDVQSVTIDGDVLNVRDDTGLDSFLLELQYRFGARGMRVQPMPTE
jgi:OOP family OmpA-OmpF porin